jgi:hypothetical protein
MPIAGPRRPVVAPTVSARSPNSAPSSVIDAAAAAAYEMLNPRSTNGPNAIIVMNSTKPRTVTPVSSASAFSISILVRETGVASRTSSVPVSSSPATARAPRPMP